MMVVVAATLLCAGAASASADQLQASVQSSAPEQGVPVTLLFSGAAGAIDQYGDGPYLYAVVRPAGGIACQQSYGSDQAAAGGASYDLFNNSIEVAPGTISRQATFNPPGASGYLICAWLEDIGTDNSSNPAPSTDVSAGTSATFSTRGPQVEELNVALGSRASPGIAYQINYTTQTDQQLNLYSVVKPAGGMPCATSYELEQQQNQAEHDVFSGYTPVFGGAVASTATDTEQAAGPYIVCSWIEGPNAGEVDTATTTAIYVGSPPPSHGQLARLTPATELAAFLHWIASRYPSAHGYWVCPGAQISAGVGLCLAEIKIGRYFHSLHAAVTIRSGQIVLEYRYDTAWVRHWSRFKRRIIAGLGTSGTASVNSPAYDWSWLAAGAHYDWQQHRSSFSVIDYDGDSRGFSYLFKFHCRVHGRSIICTNALGDSMRYRPRG